jgi:hypothetical protein
MSNNTEAEISNRRLISNQKDPRALVRSLERHTVSGDCLFLEEYT